MIPSPPPANIHYTRSQPTSLATSLPPGSTHFPNSHQSPLPRLNQGHSTNGYGQEVGSGYPVSSSAFLNTGTGDSSHQQGCSKGCRGRRGKPPIPTGTPLGFLGSLTPPPDCLPSPRDWPFGPNWPFGLRRITRQIRHFGQKMVCPRAPPGVPPWPPVLLLQQRQHPDQESGAGAAGACAPAPQPMASPHPGPAIFTHSKSSLLQGALAAWGEYCRPFRGAGCRL